MQVTGQLTSEGGVETAALRHANNDCTAYKHIYIRICKYLYIYIHTFIYSFTHIFVGIYIYIFIAESMAKKLVHLFDRFFAQQILQLGVHVHIAIGARRSQTEVRKSVAKLPKA